jgi:tripartite ATP-independent transporter DctP family solute receptor
MGGYGPPTTGFSKALKFIGERLEAEFGDGVDIKYVWNIMDLGYRGEDILWLVENGLLTLGYQSSSYLTARVPELGFADLPFLFKDNNRARAAIDGELGSHLAQKIEDRIGYRILGYFENGFRQISNRLRPVRTPGDLAGMKIRVLPSDVQARTFELLGATPLKMDLTEAIDGVVNGTLDAQENPLANTVTYGVHKFHRYHTLSNHFYISRPIFAHRDTVDAWPDDLRAAMNKAVRDSIVFQRGLAEQESVDARKAIEDEGCEIVELTPREHNAFVQAVGPQHEDAREIFGDEMFRLAKL